MLIQTTRRHFLRGLGLGAGALMLAPLTRHLVRSARGEVSTESRFVLWGTADGLKEPHRPVLGASETDFSLEALSPLEPLRDKLLWVEELYNPFDLDLHGNDWAWSVTQSISSGDDKLPGGPSIDRFIAQQIGQNDPITSVNLKPTVSANSGSGSSADGPGEPYPAEESPVEAFASIFGAIIETDGGPSLTDRLAQDLSVLDYMTDDIQRVSARLATAEKAQLDQYLDSVRGLEQKLSALANFSCGDLPAPAASLGEDLRDAREEIFDAHIDIVVNALACGLTHVAAFHQHSKTLPFLGVDGEVGSHKMWHGDGTEEKYTAYFSFQARKMKAIYDKLALFPDGDGTLADSTVIAFFPRNGGKHHNGAYNLQALILGDAGGYLNTGRFVRLEKAPIVNNDPRVVPQGGDDDKRAPKEGKDAPVHCVSDLFVTLANAVGVETDSFGDPSQCQGVLEVLRT